MRRARRASGSSSTSSRTTAPTAPLVPGRPRRRRRARRSARCSRGSGPGRGPNGDGPPTDWRGLRRAGVDPRADAGRPPGEWYLHLFDPSSRTSTGTTRRSGRVRAHPALLVRPRPGRLPDRRRGGAVQGPGAARRAQARPSAARRPEPATPWTRGPRRSGGLAADRRCIRPAADVRGRGRGAARSGSPAISARTSCTPRSTSSTSRPRGRAGRLPGGRRRHPRGPAREGAPATWVLESHDQPATRTRLARRPGWTSTTVPAGGGRRRGSAGARAGGALLLLSLPGPRLPLPGRGAGPGGGLWSSRTPPSGTPRAPLANGADGLRAGCRVPIPWDDDGADFGFGPTGRPWLPMPPDWADACVEGARPVTPASTLAYGA